MGIVQLIQSFNCETKAAFENPVTGSFFCHLWGLLKSSLLHHKEVHFPCSDKDSKNKSQRLSSLSESVEERKRPHGRFSLISPVKSQTSSRSSERIAEQSVGELETKLKTINI